MRLILASLCLAIPALAHAAEPYGPACSLPAAVMRDMPEDTTAFQLDGEDAARLVSAVNDVGEKTDFHASTIVIRLFRDHALVVLFSPCALTTVRLPLDEMREAWEAARGVKV